MDKKVGNPSTPGINAIKAYLNSNHLGEAGGTALRFPVQVGLSSAELIELAPSLNPALTPAAARDRVEQFQKRYPQGTVRAFASFIRAGSTDFTSSPDKKSQTSDEWGDDFAVFQAAVKAVAAARSTDSVSIERDAKRSEFAQGKSSPVHEAQADDGWGDETAFMRACFDACVRAELASAKNEK